MTSINFSMMLAPDRAQPAMKRLICAFALLSLSVGCAAFAAGAQSTPIEVRQGWIRWLPAGLPAAGYLTILNQGDKPVALVKASSPDYGNVMLHRSVAANGKDRMVMVKRLTIPAHGKVDIAPGGYHLMLMQATQSVSPGDDVPVSLQFSDGTIVHARLKVRQANQLN